MFCIFDLDGTLLDTLSDLANAHNMALSKRGLMPIDTNRYRFLVGKGLRNLCHQTLSIQDEQYPNLPEEQQTLALEEHLHSFQQIYQEHLMDETVPYAGIYALLDSLKENKIDIAVLSNKADPLTKKLITHFFPNYTFLFIEGMNADWPRKPDAAFVLELCSKYAKSPTETYFIGDTSTDMQTAVNAGFRPIGVSWGFRSREELLEHGAAEVFDTAEELSRYLVNR